jgi:hypothetical protein
VTRAFRPCRCGDCREPVGASGDLLRDQRGMRRCPGGKRDGIRTDAAVVFATNPGEMRRPGTLCRGRRASIDRRSQKTARKLRHRRRRKLATRVLASARDDRNAPFVTPRHDCRDLPRFARQADGVGAAVNAAGLRLVRKVVRARCRRHGVVAEERRQVVGNRLRTEVGRPVSIFPQNTR